MITDDLDSDYEAQRIALADTITWDRIYARACRSSRETRYAQPILERSPAEYELVDRQSPDALRIKHLNGAKIHVILDWEG